MLRPVFAALAAAAMLAPRVSANPRSIPSQTFPNAFGVNIHFTQGKPGEVKALSAAYKVARMDMLWDSIEKVRGEYNFAKYDVLVKDLEAAGVRPLFILDYGNNVYGKGPVRTPEQRKGYAAFAAAAAKHYKGHKIMWEFWNEPNGVGFWGDRPDPDEYAAMVNEAGPAIRRADPDATLLLGAFASFPWDFIETVFKRGCLKWADAVSVHPYRSGYPETVDKDYQRLRRMIAQYSPNRDVPIISGEWGYSTNRKTGIPELRQAQYLVRQRLINVRCGMLTSIWYDWKDDGPDPDENEHRFGSTKQDFSRKPAYTAAVTMAKTLAGYEYVRMLEDGPGKYAMLLRNAKGESAIVLWNVGTVKNYRLPAKPAKLIGMLGEKLPAVVDVPIGPSPAYALFGKSALLDGFASWTFIKRDTAIVAGTPMKAVFTARNTGNKAQRFEVAFKVGGGVVTPSSAILSVPPHKKAAINVVLDVWRRDPQTTVAVSIVSSAGRDGATLPLIVSNPLEVNVDGATGGSITATLYAPGVRKPETVTVRRTDRSGKPVGPTVSVRLRPGVSSYSTELSLGVSGGRPLSYGALVADKSGRDLAMVAPMGFQPILRLEGSQTGQTPVGLAIHSEGDPLPGGSATITTAPTATRGKVADIRAVFPDGWRYFVVTPTKVGIPDNAVAVGMWVNGDECGDIIRVRVIDAKGQDYQPTYGPVNWKGWRWITMRLDDPAVGSWGGPQDGIIHRPIRWDSVFLLDSGSRKAHSARVQVADVTLLTR